MRTLLIFILSVLPQIFPDYREVTVPENIAPLNFSITEPSASAFRATFTSGPVSFTVKSRSGDVTIPEKKWKALLMEGNGTVKVEASARKDGGWIQYKPFSIYVSRDRIDSHIAYRLIPPGYEVWGRMGIYQRCLETYEQTPIAENRLTEDNCMNCHSFANRNPDRMMLHMRAQYGGTYILRDGGIEKVNTKTPGTIAAGVYPQWSNDGRYICFSVNDIAQIFHSTDPNRVEVYDYESDVVVYDVERHELLFSELTKSPDWFETMPCFSPDGRSLYFCRSAAVKNMPQDYRKAQYNIVKISFDPETRRFGDTLETVYDAVAEGRSASMPRVSPDGRYLLFTHQTYGQFPIWHKDADLYLVNLADGTVSTLEGLNSPDVDSYHSWSSSGRWVVFSSRRDDGLYTKPYLAHIDAEGKASKPFLLPQKNPREFYLRLMVSYNIPEFITGKVKAGPDDFARTAIEGTAVGVTSRKSL